jgi:hypothetical protein
MAGWLGLALLLTLALPAIGGRRPWSGDAHLPQLAVWAMGALLPSLAAAAALRAAPWLWTWQRQSQLRLPDEPASWLSHGVVGLLALWGIARWWADGRAGRLAPVVSWAIVAQLALSFAPWPLSRSWVGIATPLGLLAGHGLVDGLLPWLAGRWAWLRRVGRRATLARLLLLAAAPTSVLLAATGLVPYSQALALSDPAFLPSGVPAVLARAGTGGGLVASAPDTGLWVPLQAPPGLLRPVVAHRSETLDYARELQAERKFLRAWASGDPAAAPPEHARWVVWGPAEAELAGLPPAPAPATPPPGYRLVAQVGGVSLYEHETPARRAPSRRAADARPAP